MLSSLLLGSTLLLAQVPTSDSNFIKLQNKLENYGFAVNIAIPPDFVLPKQEIDFQRRRSKKPYGILNSASKSIWINPIVFELGISNSVLVHEAVHAAQFCRGGNNLQALELDFEPIAQAQPFFKRYVNIHHQILEKEAYAVQTQINSFELVISLLDRYC